MSKQAAAVRVPTGPRVVFGCLAWGNTTLSVAKHYGFVGATTKTRVVGCAMGLVIVGFGFFLRKLHARAVLPEHSSKAAADRLFGRALMAVGLADAALFASGPLDQARLISLSVGIAVLLAVVAAWSWRLRKNATPADDRATQRRMLLGASVYIAATCAAAFLIDNGTWAAGLAPWMIVVFWLMYIAGSAAAIDRRNQLVKV